MQAERPASISWSSLLCACALLCAPGATAQGYSVWKFTGGESSSLAVVGDVSGDGIADLAVGSIGAFSSSGSGPPRVEVLSGADGAMLFTIPQPAGIRFFGWSVAAGGDLNGDGIPDLLVGDFFGGPAGPGFGGVWAFSGSGGALLFSVGGTESGAAFGSTLVSAGDVDLDGVPDFLVGSPSRTVGGSLLVGEVQLFSGATRAVLRTWTGTAQVDAFGISLANLGDLDGDGIAEFAVGATQPGTGNFTPPFTGPGAGYVEVYSAATGAARFSVRATRTGDAFGAALAAAGDVDGDGTVDLLVGATQAYPCSDETCFRGSGYAQVLSGSDGRLLRTFAGGATFGEMFGASVTAAGDVDGDGVSDALIGAPGRDAQTVAPPGYAALCSGATGNRLLVLTTTSGSTSGDEFGRHVAVLADADGDGFPELVVTDGDVTLGINPFQAFVERFSPVGIPAGSARIGAGCPGTGGLTPAIATFGGVPNATAGNPSFGLAVSGGPPGAPALLVAATAGDPTGVSIGGCNLHLAGTLLPVFAVATGARGHRLSRFAIPVLPVLAGQSLAFQWLVVDAGSPNGLFTTSDGLVLGFQ